MVQNRFVGRMLLIQLRRTFPEGLKEQFQSELHQSRVCTWRRRGHHPKVLIIGATADCVWRLELGSVKQVKEFCSKLDAQPLAARESGFLE